MDKEYAHRGCIGAKLQGEPIPLGCNYNITDFRRPDGSVRLFVVQLNILISNVSFYFQKIDKVTSCGCKTDLCNESVSDAAESDGMRWGPALFNLLFTVVIVFKISKNNWNLKVFFRFPFGSCSCIIAIKIQKYILVCFLYSKSIISFIYIVDDIN